MATKRGLTRREVLKLAGLAGAGLVIGPTILRGGSAAIAAAGSDSFWFFTNNTKGKWKDSEVFVKFGGNAVPLSEKKEYGPQGGGRIYFSLGGPSGKTGGGNYADFMEYNHKGGTWWGNTSTVDAFVIPISFELFNTQGESVKRGITGQRTKMFDNFKKDTSEEFHGCQIGNDKIIAPGAADLGQNKKYAKYFEPYVDELWKMYEKETKTPSGKYTGKADPSGALVYKPVDGEKFRGDPKWLTCASKPSTWNILGGTGVLGQNPGMAAAFNRGVADDPGVWLDNSKFYKKKPNNEYSKYLHAYSIDDKCYGFSYDDCFDFSTLVHYDGNAAKCAVSINWD
jgi:hypothetical protein